MGTITCTKLSYSGSGSPPSTSSVFCVASSCDAERGPCLPGSCTASSTRSPAGAWSRRSATCPAASSRSRRPGRSPDRRTDAPRRSTRRVSRERENSPNANFQHALSLFFLLFRGVHVLELHQMLLQTLRALAFARQRFRQAALSLRRRLGRRRSRRFRVRLCMKYYFKKSSYFPSPIARFWRSVAECARCSPPGPAIKTRSHAYRHLELHAHLDQLIGELLVRGLHGLDRGSYAITRFSRSAPTKRRF